MHSADLLLIIRRAVVVVIVTDTSGSDPDSKEQTVLQHSVATLNDGKSRAL